ncbi:hypothetical protein WSM22_40580 [Cytophagales bacterium WSM2-2]|nr:hypothetical protein WSM22_40580 [Cytophagales bacterium WSM2-2]
MKKSKKEITEEVKADKELRPYFIDYLGENLKMTFGQRLELEGFQSQRFTDCADSKLAALMWKLESRVPKQYVDYVLHEVCLHYASITVLKADRIDLRRLAFTI